MSQGRNPMSSAFSPEPVFCRDERAIKHISLLNVVRERICSFATARMGREIRPALGATWSLGAHAVPQIDQVKSRRGKTRTKRDGDAEMWFCRRRFSVYSEYNIGCMTSSRAAAREQASRNRCQLWERFRYVAFRPSTTPNSIPTGASE
jgi:hypothetical protein